MSDMKINWVATAYESSADASHLGLTPGHWPAQIHIVGPEGTVKTFVQGKIICHRGTREVASVDYNYELGGRAASIRIYND